MMNHLIAQAISAFEDNDFEQLENHLRPLLMQDPLNEVGLLLLARFHRHHEQYDACRQVLADFIAHYPDNAEGFISMGNLFAHQEFQERSLAWYHIAADLAPKRIDLWQNWGHALFDLKQYHNAQKKYAQALILEAQNPSLIFSYSCCLRELGELHNAEKQIRTLLQKYPGNAQYWGLLAALKRDKNHHDLADRYYKHALQLDPNGIAFLFRRGEVLIELGDMIQAKELFDEALRIITQYEEISALEQTKLLSEVSKHLAYWHLHQGNYQTGFRLLESRFISRDAASLWYDALQASGSLISPLSAVKRTPGQLSGKHILLIAEQNSEDTLQFIRYAQVLMQRHQVRAITVMCDSHLKRLLQKQNYISHVIFWNPELFKDTELLHEWLEKQQFDYFSSVTSLPHFFDATVDDLYAPISYLKPVYELDNTSANTNESLNVISKSLPLLTTSTIQWLKHETRPKIGIVWSVGTDFTRLSQDEKRNNIYRSIPLKQLKTLLELEHLAFVALQKEEDRRYKELLDLQHEEPVFHQLQVLEEFYPHNSDVNINAELDYAITAQIINELDLVITVDASMVHLSAALGKPTWLLNCKNTSWRFAQGNQDTHSIWYPSIRIFSQHQFNEWDLVVGDILKLLN